MHSAVKANRLINETSPYLLQHAYNPVDWYPWGEEAFEKARKEDKPVFLSIGYSTCHWCHVMARESFEDEEVARVLNESYVPVKVDREERPDVDEVYMDVCQALTGSGGWPLTIIMTPDGKPFFAGTYLPKRGLIELLEKVKEIWKTDREKLIKNAEEITGYFRGLKRGGERENDAEKVIRRAYAHIADSFDEEYGGFSQSPKFPVPHYLYFLLCYYKAYGDEKALGMAEKTLECMYRGGIFDHVGGGFSRYSTDRRWLVPHFEKMLYDNALLILAYTECFAATRKPFYREAAEAVIGYAIRVLRSPEGAFYSAEDADSEGAEGKFYVWDYGELSELLTPEELRYAEKRFGVTKRGNFEGKNILNLLNGAEKDSAAEARILRKLFLRREKRTRPFLDTKILASWNGFMIEALSRAAAVFGEREYEEYAAATADFVTAKIRETKNGGFLADYANLGNALIALYQATLEMKYLGEAKKLAGDMLRTFWDGGEKRFYMRPKGNEELFMRARDEYDAATPSGNSGAIMLLSSLHRLTGSEELRETLDGAVLGFLPAAAAAPMGAVSFLTALLMRVTPRRQAVISARKDDEKAMGLYKELISRFDPFTTVIYYDGSEEAREAFPELAQYAPAESFAGYLCENFTCGKPAYSVEEFARVLEAGRVSGTPSASGPDS